MLKDKLNSIFQTYVEQYLTPKEKERGEIGKHYEDIRKFLGTGCFQSGSYARLTSTTPVNDLDVIWVMPQSFIEKAVIKRGVLIDPNHLNPSKILSDLAQRLDSAYKKDGQSVRIKSQSHSVGVYFGKSDEEFSIDVVPAIISGEKNPYGDDIYWVPQIASLSKTRRLKKYATGDSIDWIKSDPKGYISDASDLNSQNKNFKKAVKFVRKWRRGCKEADEDFPMKSFHLELIMNDVFKENLAIGTFEGIQIFFSKASTYLDQPNFADRANPSQFVDEYIARLSDTEKSKVVARIEAASSTLSEIANFVQEQTLPVLIEEVLSGGKIVLTKSLTRARAGQIALGDSSHKKDLSSINVIEQRSYPCKVEIKAGLWFKGPRDREINKRYQRPISSGSVVPTYHDIHYEATTDAPVPYRLYWQVVNTGKHAEYLQGLRGEIFEGEEVQVEQSLYTGKHWIECFVVTEDGVCIARSGPFYVTFLNPLFPVALLGPAQ